MKPVELQVIEALTAYLHAAMPELVDILDDWPEPNQQLAYPSLSILTGAPVFTPQSEEYLEADAADESNTANARYLIGSEDYRLQLDFWVGSKPERQIIYDKFFRVFNSQRNVTGLSLALEDYYGELARFELRSVSFPDTAEQAQRSEWRIVVILNAAVNRIKERVEPIILNPGLVTTDDIRTDFKGA